MAYQKPQQRKEGEGQRLVCTELRLVVYLLVSATDNLLHRILVFTHKQNDATSSEIRLHKRGGDQFKSIDFRFKRRQVERRV